MKKQLLVLATFFVIGLASCTGKKADENNEDIKYKYTDTVKKDTTVHDSSGKDAYQDSTSNAPRLPGGN